MKPVVEIILDGWGVAPPSRANAITQAKTPNLDVFVHEYPALTLQASGESVGLPWGEPGNSEVGHLALGSGKIVYQEFPLINKAIRDESFFHNAALLGGLSSAKQAGRSVHLVGLLSTGGVHSYLDHVFALLDLCQREGVERVFVHVILDGRDTVYNSGADFIERLEQKMSELGLGQVASVSGRFWGMDRDHHWERTQKSYEAIMLGKADQVVPNAVEAVRASYALAVFDEEMNPFVIENKGAPIGQVHDGDTIIFFNFRPDRMRQLVTAVTQPEFASFDRGAVPHDLTIVTLTEYDPDLPVQVAFPRDHVNLPLAKIISDAGKTQLHIAETEKYAHVTYFFNGGVEVPFPGEDHVLIPSKRVVSYAEEPEMSAREITDAIVNGILAEKYDFIVANFANADMVAHTGDEPATMKAIEYLDARLGEIADAVLAKGGVLIVTADHGNAEVLLNVQTGEIDKEHNASPVPLLVIANDLRGKSGGSTDAVGGDLSLLTPAGVLADVAPTVLKFLDLPIPKEMTGRALL